MSTIPLDDSLSAYNNVMNLRQKKIAYTKAQIDLVDKKNEFAEKYSQDAVATRQALAKSNLYKAYTEKQQNYETALDTIGRGQVEQLRNLGERSQVALGGLPLNNAMQLQHDTSKDNGQIIVNSHKAQQDISQQLGLSADVNGRIDGMLLDNGRMATGKPKLTPDTETKANALTKALFKGQNLTKEDMEAPEVVDGSELSQKLLKVQQASVQAFTKLENQPNMSPTERMLQAVSQGVAGEELSPQQTKLVISNVMGSIEGVQNTKVQKALIDSSITYNQNIEAGGAFIDNSARSMAQTDPDVAAAQLKDSVGAFDMIKLIGTTQIEFGDDAVWEELGTKIADRKKAFDVEWNNYTPSQQFAMYVDSVIDNSARKANVLQENGLVNGAINAAELMQRANRSGELFEKFPAMAQTFTEGFTRFKQGQASMFEKQAQQVQQAAVLGGKGTPTYNAMLGKPVFINSNNQNKKDKATYESDVATLLDDDFIRERLIDQGAVVKGDKYYQTNADKVDVNGEQQLSSAHTFVTGKKTEYPLVHNEVGAPTWDLNDKGEKYQALMPTVEKMSMYSKEQWEDEGNQMVGGKKGYNLWQGAARLGYGDVLTSNKSTTAQKQAALLATQALLLQTSDLAAQGYESSSLYQYAKNNGVPSVMEPYMSERGFTTNGFAAVDNAIGGLALRIENAPGGGGLQLPTVGSIEQEDAARAYDKTTGDDITMMLNYLDKIDDDSKAERKRNMAAFGELTPVWQRFEDTIKEQKKALRHYQVKNRSRWER